jgi:hypothetical protein
VLLRGAMKAIRATGTSFLVGRLRLATGLVLFAYVVTHDLNHMLGIVCARARLSSSSSA